jgi:hypothetical protein
LDACRISLKNHPIFTFSVRTPFYAWLLKGASGHMPDTGEDRELKQRVNANESEVIREEKTLDRKLKADLNSRKKAPGQRKSKPKK